MPWWRNVDLVETESRMVELVRAACDRCPWQHVPDAKDSMSAARKAAHRHTRSTEHDTRVAVTLTYHYRRQYRAEADK